MTIEQLQLVLQWIGGLVVVLLVLVGIVTILYRIDD